MESFEEGQRQPGLILLRSKQVGREKSSETMASIQSGLNRAVEAMEWMAQTEDEVCNYLFPTPEII